MDAKTYDMGKIDIAWCPGCGDFGILKLVKTALSELDIAPEQIVMVSGIGQAAKLPQYMRGNFFNGLHGRALPPATAIKAANPHLTVIAESGDGDMYGEGGNHFIHCIRRNPNITNLVHDNQVYGLTKGQASPTSMRGFKTPVQVNGVILEPFNPLAVAIALDVSFVARVFVKDAEKSVEVIKQAIQHPGYALVDIFQPCVTFNRINTYQWYTDHTYWMEDHDPADRNAAFARATETDTLPLGVFYINPNKTPFERNQPVYKDDDRPLWQRSPDTQRISSLVQSMVENLL
ncbi:MAG: hypothetical protein JW828_01945 [Sedimentisphaerales bacterium]|nr:hypothetical protein [Sedimentisphaerales bacterium]